MLLHDMYVFHHPMGLLVSGSEQKLTSCFIGTVERTRPGSEHDCEGSICQGVVMC